MFPILLAPYFLAIFVAHTLNPWLLPCVAHVTERSCKRDYRCQPYSLWRSSRYDNRGVPTVSFRFSFCNSIDTSKQAEKMTFVFRCQESGGTVMGSECDCQNSSDKRIFANKKWSISDYGCLSLEEICSLSNEKIEQLSFHEKNTVRTFYPNNNDEENILVSPTPTSGWSLIPLTPTSTATPTLIISSTPQPSLTPTEIPSLIPTILTQPTLTPSESNITETIQTYKITNSPNQITFLINLATASSSFSSSSLQAEFTDPRWRTINIANHLDPGIYFVIERAYQLLRLNSPSNIEGTWTLRIRAPLGMEYLVHTMQF